MYTPPLRLRRDGSSPSEQICAHFAAAIGSGALRPGDRLPTIRKLAEHTGAPRAAVQHAYHMLRRRGLVQATVGRGTTVAAAPAAMPSVGPLSPAARAALRHLDEGGGAAAWPDGVAPVADFGQFLPDSADFAVAEFRAALALVLRQRGAELLSYGDPDGDEQLRSLLSASDGSGDDGLLVTSGAQQGIDLVLRACTSPGDAVVVPVPCYHHLFGLLSSHGLRAVPVPWLDGGIDEAALDQALREPAVRLLYVMPTFQNPTGRSLDAAARRRLMATVAATGVVVLEDDCARELRFRGEPLPCLRQLDRRGRTVTVRSFSKELFPGVRVGWIRGAPDLLAGMAALKRYCDLETTPLLQAALVAFVGDGGLDRSLAQLRHQLGERHGVAQAALRQRLGGSACRWTDPDGGFALWLELPAPADGAALASLALARGVRVTPGCVFHPERLPGPGLRLSLSRARPAEIDAGIDVLVRCIRTLTGAGSPRRRSQSLLL